MESIIKKLESNNDLILYVNNSFKTYDGNTYYELKLSDSSTYNNPKQYKLFEDKDYE